MSYVSLFALNACILAYALLGGVFLAFSDFIMRALARTGGSGGIEAMQHINREVFRWAFMTLFLGMGAVSLLLVGLAAYGVFGAASGAVAAAALIYVLGCFLSTVVFNVPMNEALAKMDASGEQAREYWSQTYVPRWTAWNTVRALACIVAAGVLLFGLSGTA